MNKILLIWVSYITWLTPQWISSPPGTRLCICSSFSLYAMYVYSPCNLAILMDMSRSCNLSLARINPLTRETCDMLLIFSHLSFSNLYYSLCQDHRSRCWCVESSNPRSSFFQSALWLSTRIHLSYPPQSYTLQLTQAVSHHRRQIGLFCSAHYLRSWVYLPTPPLY